MILILNDMGIVSVNSLYPVSNYLPIKNLNTTIIGETGVILK